mgnify:CR=1 FL=1|jgi:hypothetical protein
MKVAKEAISTQNTLEISKKVFVESLEVLGPFMRDNNVSSEAIIKAGEAFKIQPDGEVKFVVCGV